jgi:Uma2 family endonuclease
LPEQRVVLHNVSWETLERLLAEHIDCSSPRFTFDHGELEIVTLSAEHERYNRRITDLVGVLADQMDLEVDDLGSTTYKRQEFERGFAPDSCFYVQKVEQVLGKDRIDLAVEPAPDLVVELDITNPSISKLPMFAEFGVPEMWRFDGERLAILRLRQGSYQAVEKSEVFQEVSAGAVEQLLGQGKSLGRIGWLRLVAGAWAGERYGKSSAQEEGNS